MPILITSREGGGVSINKWAGGKPGAELGGFGCLSPTTFVGSKSGLKPPPPLKIRLKALKSMFKPTTSLKSGLNPSKGELFFTTFPPPPPRLQRTVLVLVDLKFKCSALIEGNPSQESAGFGKALPLKFTRKTQNVIPPLPRSFKPT